MEEVSQQLRNVRKHRIGHIQKSFTNIDDIEKAGKSYFSPKEREKLSEKKEAMPDGSFPIRNTQDLKDAVQSIGRAKDYNKTKRWIIKRARELGSVNLLPEDWNIQKSLDMIEKAIQQKELPEDFLDKAFGLEDNDIEKALDVIINNLDVNTDESYKLLGIEVKNLIKKGFSVEKVDELIKARTGVYKDTPENRKLGRVGQKYGVEKKEGVDKKEEYKVGQEVDLDGYKGRGKMEIRAIRGNEIVLADSGEEKASLSMLFSKFKNMMSNKKQ